jgi:Tol biopolymer transport system component
MDADGTNERRLTAHPASDGDPDWSPDGTQILFTSKRDGDPALFIMDLNGRIVRRVTDERFPYIEGSSCSTQTTRAASRPLVGGRPRGAG